MNNFFKKKILQIFVATAVFITPIPSLNYLVDPFWCFDHVILLGRYQTGFDERQQKANFLMFNKGAYDTFLLGNSRVSYTDPRDIPGKAFNFTVSSMRSSELLPYLKFASSRNSKPITTIILGVSFYETNGANPGSFSPPEEYIKNASTPGFRYRALFSIGLFRHTVSNIKRDLVAKNRLDAYERERKEVLGRQMPLPVPEEVRGIAITANIAEYRRQINAESYEYLDLKPVFNELKEAFPEARFLIFTTPVSAHLLKILLEQDRLEDYKRWVSGLVEVFGEAWNFMYFNEVTLNDLNYKDAHHYSPWICRAIIHKIYGLPDDGQFSDFGKKVTVDSLHEHLAFLDNNMAKHGHN